MKQTLDLGITCIFYEIIKKVTITVAHNHRAGHLQQSGMVIQGQAESAPYLASGRLIQDQRATRNW